MNNKCLHVLFIGFHVTGPGLSSPEAFARTDIASTWLGSKIMPGDLNAGADTDQMGPHKPRR